MVMVKLGGSEVLIQFPMTLRTSSCLLLYLLNSIATGQLLST